MFLYVTWCLLVELSGHGHPEGAEVLAGSDICAVQALSLEPSYREVRAPRGTLLTEGVGGRTLPNER